MNENKIIIRGISYHFSYILYKLIVGRTANVGQHFVYLNIQHFKHIWSFSSYFTHHKNLGTKNISRQTKF
jgi:hypothetical protein